LKSSVNRLCWGRCRRGWLRHVHGSRLTFEGGCAC
jgi:hypothetical protein